jgi:hypothetical protein
MRTLPLGSYAMPALQLGVVDLRDRGLVWKALDLLEKFAEHEMDPPVNQYPVLDREDALPESDKQPEMASPAPGDGYLILFERYVSAPSTILS